MGLIYSKIDLFAESENCYEKALKLEPENDSYKKNLEVSFWFLGNLTHFGQSAKFLHSSFWTKGIFSDKILVNFGELTHFGESSHFGKSLASS